MFDLTKIKGVCDERGNPFFIFVIMDHFTKYLWTTLVRGKHKGPIARFLYTTFRREGLPERWHADNGSEFRNDAVDLVRQKLIHGENMNMILPFSRSRPRNPQVQGLVEKQNDTLTKKIYKAVIDEFNRWVGT